MSYEKPCEKGAPYSLEPPFLNWSVKNHFKDHITNCYLTGFTRIVN